MGISSVSRSVIVATFVFASQFWAAAQGSLTPPGPPGLTMKSLDQIETRIPISATTTPGDGSDNFIITKPGSYYLTTNFVNSAAKNGIRIATNNVTIDLNGYALDGAGLGSLGIRIITSIHRQNVQIRNGTVCNWNSSGIELSFGVNTLVEKVLVTGNGGNGIETGENGIIKDCAAYTNANSISFSAGIVTQQGATVENCVADFNGNNNDTCFGISVGAGCTVTHCNVSQNNSQHGIGISTGPYCVVTECTASFATGTNGAGISLAFSSQAIRCNASGNSGAGTVGILAAQHCLIENCIASNNGGDGIQTTEDCSVTGNSCDSNLATGIHTTGQRNRIDSNHAALNTAGGIKVDSNLSLIVRNSATGSGVNNFIISGGNNDAARVTGGTAFTGVDPWANFSF